MLRAAFFLSLLCTWVYLFNRNVTKTIRFFLKPLKNHEETRAPRRFPMFFFPFSFTILQILYLKIYLSMIRFSFFDCLSQFMGRQRCCSTASIITQWCEENGRHISQNQKQKKISFLSRQDFCRESCETITTVLYYDRYPSTNTMVLVMMLIDSRFKNSFPCYHT